MKQITLNIPDSKYKFFMELRESLKFVKVNDDIEIPKEHKDIVRERIRKSKPEELILWNDARKQFRFKNKS